MKKYLTFLNKLKKFTRPQILFVVSMIAVLVLSQQYYFRKWFGYEAIPTFNIFDEINYPFAGYTFKTTGVPTGWTNMDTYKIQGDRLAHTSLGFDGLHITSKGDTPSLVNKDSFNYPVTWVTDVDVYQGKETITVVQPFMDHPLFGSWLFALPIKNVANYDTLTPRLFRQTPLVLSVLTGILLFILTYLLYRNILVSFLAFILYSSVPNFIFVSRYALLENVLIPLFLLSSIFIQLFLQSKKSLYLIIAGIFAGLAFITKEQGIFIFLTAIFILGTSSFPKKKILFYILPFSLISGIYYTYAFYLAPRLMTELLFLQANRGFFGSLNFISSLTQLNFSGLPKDGYWLFGLISLTMLVFKDNLRHRYLAVSFAAFICTFIFFGGLNYSWYYLPFLPMFVIAAAYFIYDFITRPTIVSLLIIFILPFSSSFFWGFSVFQTGASIIAIYRLSIIAFLLAFLAFHLPPIHRFKLGKIFWVIFSLLLLYQINKWNNQSFLYLTKNWKNLPETYTIH